MRVCVPVCTCVSSLFVLFPCVTFSHRHACHCRNSNAVTYARSLAPWLTGRLLRRNQKDVGTDHTSPSSFLGLTDGLSLSSSYAFSALRDTFLRRISRTKSNEVWGGNSDLMSSNKEKTRQQTTGVCLISSELVGNDFFVGSAILCKVNQIMIGIRIM